MKENQVAKQFEWLGEYYRITKYFGANVACLERLEKTKWLKTLTWKTIYMGHIDVLKESVEFFEANN